MVSKRPRSNFCFTPPQKHQWFSPSKYLAMFYFPLFASYCLHRSCAFAFAIAYDFYITEAPVTSDVFRGRHWVMAPILAYLFEFFFVCNLLRHHMVTRQTGDLAIRSSRELRPMYTFVGCRIVDFGPIRGYVLSDIINVNRPDGATYSQTVYVP